jgi:hypothetical protein
MKFCTSLEMADFEIVGAVTRLSHRRCVDVDLNFGLALRENIGLEIRRDLDDKEQFALVHLRIDVGRLDLHCWLECRTHQALGDLPRELRAILVGDTDREVGCLSDRAGRDRVDGNRERIDDKNEHGRI